ncbi:MAG: glycosyltransferase [Acidobacteriota bacterium]
MTFTVSFVERRDPETSSIERLIRTVGIGLSELGVKVRYDKVPYGNSTAGIFANLFAPKPKRADIFHVTGHINYYALLLPALRTVLTMHDIRILGMRSGIRRYLIKKFFFDLPTRRLDYIVTGTEAAKQDLVRITNCRPEKIHVIGHPLTVEPSEHARKFDHQNPRILQIGTAPNKNLIRLASALKGIRCVLIIIGRLDEPMERALRENQIVFENRFDLSDEQIRNEYANSDIVAFCSTSEGFGLPIIEAQAMSIPVVTSSVDPMKDVAGSGAILADPFDVESIRTCIQMVVEDGEFRKACLESGRRNIARFAPDRIAREYFDLYQKVLEKLS